MSFVSTTAAVLFPHLMRHQSEDCTAREPSQPRRSGGRPERGFPQPHIKDDGVPRNAMGWPVIEPRQMTTIQLIREAEKWAGDDNSDCRGRGPTQIEEFKKYAGELMSRGYLEELEFRKWERTGRTPLFVKDGHHWHAEFD